MLTFCGGGAGVRDPQLESDPGAPPKKAWRRKLNCTAGFLKEFSVTFMEAIKMVKFKFVNNASHALSRQVASAETARTRLSIALMFYGVGGPVAARRGSWGSVGYCSAYEVVMSGFEWIVGACEELSFMSLKDCLSCRLDSVCDFWLT